MSTDLSSLTHSTDSFIHSRTSRFFLASLSIRVGTYGSATNRSPYTYVVLKMNIGSYRYEQYCAYSREATVLGPTGTGKSYQYLSCCATCDDLRSNKIIIRTDPPPSQTHQSQQQRRSKTKPSQTSNIHRLSYSYLLLFKKYFYHLNHHDSVMRRLYGLSRPSIEDPFRR
jgi:hypothetical protein